MANDQKFTFEQYCNLIRENTKLTDGFKFQGDKSLYFHFRDVGEVNAYAGLNNQGDQYKITFCKGLAQALYERALTDSELLIQLAPEAKLSLSQSHHLVALFSSQMVFWHEFAHIAGGHIPYLRSERGEDFATLDEQKSMSLVQRGSEEEKRLIRLVEIDADIYGAAYLFSRVLKLLETKKNKISSNILMLAFVIGLRSMYETLYSEDEDKDSENYDHPHSLVRAWVAICFGVTSEFVKPASTEERDRRNTLTKEAVLAFEKMKSCGPSDPAALIKYMSKEYADWSAWESGLAKFAIAPPRIKLSESGLSWFIRKVSEGFRDFL